MKRRIVVLSIILVMLAILTSGSLAQYVTYGTSKNVITSGNVNAVLHNRAGDQTAAGSEVRCLPGEKVDRVVTVENAGNQSFYVRIEVKKYVKDSDLSAENCLNLDLNDKDWIYRDGYYYYKEALKPGETTQPLFTEVEIDGPNVNNDYMGKTLMLDVSAYAVQSENNGETVWDAIGWPKS